MYLYKVILSCTLLCAGIHSVFGINCFQCNGTDPKSLFQCGEDLRAAGGAIDVSALPCDQVHGARYCIKHVGRYEVSAIFCYQCDSATQLECSDRMIGRPNGNITPTSCDHVYDALYCIKSTAVYGGIGAKRYCSSKDLGNYCNYVKQPGDQLEYRSCIFTCDTDGCNSAAVFLPSSLLIFTVVMKIIL